MEGGITWSGLGVESRGGKVGLPGLEPPSTGAYGKHWLVVKKKKSLLLKCISAGKYSFNSFAL